MEFDAAMNGIDVREAASSMAELMVFALGIALYAFIIFKFYKLIARRDIFPLNLEKYNTSRMPAVRKALEVGLYVLEHIIIFPALTFLWFLFFAALLTFLSEKSTPDGVLLASMAIVGAIRITAYYKEELSQEVGKLLPLVLLGVFLVDNSYFSVDRAVSILSRFPLMYMTMAYYLTFIIVLELLLRTGRSIAQKIAPAGKN
jgi:hypothetical protein